MTTDRSASATTEALRTLTKQIAAMKSMSLSELAQLHVSLFGKYPQTHNRERLVSLLARKLQEAQEGGLSRRERLRIIELRAHMPPSWEEKLSISGLDGRKAVELEGHRPGPDADAVGIGEPARAGPVGIDEHRVHRPFGQDRVEVRCGRQGPARMRCLRG